MCSLESHATTDLRGAPFGGASVRLPSRANQWPVLIAVTIAICANVFPSAGSSANDGSYCGIYSVYLCCDVLDHPVAFEDLVSPKYVTGYAGSTATDLVEAFEDHNTPARLATSLSHFDLKFAQHPLILHVRSRRGSPAVDHWVVYLGERDGKAVIYDVLQGATAVPYAEVAARWDGTAIVAASDQSYIDEFVFFAWLSRLMLISCAVGLAYVGASVWTGVPGWAVRNTEGAAIRPLLMTCLFGASVLLVSLVVGILFHLCADIGFFHSAETIGSIAGIHRDGHLPIISRRELNDLIAANASASKQPLVVVDARYADDYSSGFITNAVNYPIDIDYDSEKSLFRQIPKDSKVVVYCQSAGCDFDDEIGARLLANGYVDVVLFKEGWVGWSEQ